jgi:uncharacterized protein YecE (DUF72 family)
MKLSGELRIGICGWRYPGWRGKSYPKELPQHRELEFAGGAFNSVEINGSFYSLQRPSSYQGWYEATPTDFVFAVKGGRFSKRKIDNQPRDVFIYFDNDAKVHAPFDAIRLAKRLAINWSPQRT